MLIESTNISKSFLSPFWPSFYEKSFSKHIFLLAFLKAGFLAALKRQSLYNFQAGYQTQQRTEEISFRLQLFNRISTEKILSMKWKFRSVEMGKFWKTLWKPSENRSFHFNTHKVSVFRFGLSDDSESGWEIPKLRSKTNHKVARFSTFSDVNLLSRNVWLKIFRNSSVNYESRGKEFLIT